MALKAVTIPCKKYIAKYLYAKFNTNIGTPLIVNGNSNFSLYLKTLLSSNYKRDEKRKSLDKYDFELKLLINSYLFRHGYRLSKASVYSLNAYVRNQIFKEFKDKVKENLGSGESKEILAIEFLNTYGIMEDELSPDTILRDERRSKNKFY